MIWTDESHIIVAGKDPAVVVTDEAKAAIILISLLVVGIVISLGTLAVCG